MAKMDAADFISVSDASKLGVSGLVQDAEQGRNRNILRDDKPVAVVMSMKRFERLQQLQEDLVDITLAASRMMTTSGRRHSLDEVVEQFGYTREELADIPE
jgi:hypothetical protein